ncbi:MAG: HAD family hydrolase [Treponema sp.]|jgi:phosphoglycolate phosphatase-like HAD superfamily hydrolase|nr:HAD family hydrolase [Treponema sp.]
MYKIIYGNKHNNKTKGRNMKIVLDMDNTIIDEFGSTLRPGIINFLEKISLKHELILWTNSKRLRAMEILEYFNIRKYFMKIISRENYDPEEKGNRKDIGKYNYDIIIDDDAEEIQYNKNKGKISILVEPYRKNKIIREDELKEIIIKYKL